MLLSFTIAALVSGSRSKSRTRRLDRISPANVCSTTHRFGGGWNPFWPSGVLVTSTPTLLLSLHARPGVRVVELAGKGLTVLQVQVQPLLPEIDGVVRIHGAAGGVGGQFIKIRVTSSDAHDLDAQAIAS